MLAAHLWASGRKCRCGWRPDDRIAAFPMPKIPTTTEQYADHVAATLAAAGVLRDPDDRDAVNRVRATLLHFEQAAMDAPQAIYSAPWLSMVDKVRRDIDMPQVRRAAL